MAHMPIANSVRRRFYLREGALRNGTASISVSHLLLNNPPRRGPAIAEQLQVMLSAWDHLARFSTATISDVMTQTDATIPPPPIPATALAMMSHSMVWAAPQNNDPTAKIAMLEYRTV